MYPGGQTKKPRLFLRRKDRGFFLPGGFLPGEIWGLDLEGGEVLAVEYAFLQGKHLDSRPAFVFSLSGPAATDGAGPHLP
ncbi:MAG: hypothetical protein A2600_00200 [Candidatus Lambdaproteobacteria bacterium RIFOXYD1_FULL_56_27]|uniref:Uncharacterized protein n=1 Tax=Candidatus Lambdaproteobacteria bacterium RIFOXYD2_FULL_56_26 TaxID=1817773 RepID=A0A1F6GPH7_9PROT|nr:MAG: hypothetical protein A2557_04320 [Candidatus Lambdaproteobacteria bacterium RIFOXYD2_FULL_56_26]OGH03938.1 MAG: hypothetical protein A2426_07545 [Candidatus Lambdaproteobacteria bacterium RIFOXYC1_FULL_56_13]OGH06195.1 MAG: hypothetical protein A2600_00200 [Candidatus Lambdaproteobacteria bacterium RIFOXYD1_FULL_56_27]